MSFCDEPGCTRESVLLCDQPMRYGNCDREVCLGHAERRGPVAARCPLHRHWHAPPLGRHCHSRERRP